MSAHNHNHNNMDSPAADGDRPAPAAAAANHHDHPHPSAEPYPFVVPSPLHPGSAHDSETPSASPVPADASTTTTTTTTGPFPPHGDDHGDPYYDIDYHTQQDNADSHHQHQLPPAFPDGQSQLQQQQHHHHHHHYPDPHHDPRDSLPPLPDRSSIRKSSASSSRQSIRRKPLASTASPIAVRYSSGEYRSSSRPPSVADLPMPETRFSRHSSVESPTVYEFPRPPAGRPAAAAASSSPAQDSSDQLSSESPATQLPPSESPGPSIANKGIAPGHEDQGQHPDPASPLQSPVAAPADADPLSEISDANPAGLQTESQGFDFGAGQGYVAGVPPAVEDDDDDAGSSYSDLLDRDGDGDGPDDNDEDRSSSDNILDGYNSDSSHGTAPHSSSAAPSAAEPVAADQDMSLNTTRKAAPPTQLNITPVDSQQPETPNTEKPLPKSPSGSSKLGTFFGWGSPSANSDKGFSPLPSPFNFAKTSDASQATANGHPFLQEPLRAHDGTLLSAGHPNDPAATAAHIEEMEDELKSISSELAASIRREMDLEDLVERLQAERDNPTNSANRRTSDYFSDSGYSSAKFSEYNDSREEVEKIQRKADQEKAQVRLELTNKLQDERTRRQQLDNKIKLLSERASHIDLAEINSLDATDRMKELENTCETLRRKLSEERQVKDNFEDLLTALKGELQNASNERDNLRDEVVPSLRARVEGLEGQATELEKMTYDSTKIQQEMQTLKDENTTLKSGRFGTITEEGSPALSRSNSLNGSKLGRPPSITRSKTVKSNESREQLSDRLKDVEEQRDALHKALKNLLERQEHSTRENSKKIRALEQERNRLLAESPHKAGFQKEIASLRNEISVLRKRSDEALDAKWQVEKGLGGLKMDLDRAEQEIASLRTMLGEKDILVPEGVARSSLGSNGPVDPATSESLTVAYEELQGAYTNALERVKKLETSSADERTRLAMEKLEQSLSSAVTERDLARVDASTYKNQLDGLKADEQHYMESEKALADELRESARRVEELAIQVKQQLSANHVLRKRIADTVARGEADQKANKDRITAMQARLRFLEEKIEAAQTASEDQINRHEEEVVALKESHNNQLMRLSDGSPRTPRSFDGKSSSQLFTAPGARPPRIDTTRTGPAASIHEISQVDNLRARIAELENAIADADGEMEQVVSRMNMAQIEVLNLQEEREAAVNQTRKLERELQAEKQKSFDRGF